MLATQLQLTIVFDEPIMKTVTFTYPLPTNLFSPIVATAACAIISQIAAASSQVTPSTMQMCNATPHRIYNWNIAFLKQTYISLSHSCIAAMHARVYREIFVLKYFRATIFRGVKFSLSGPSTKIYHQVHITATSTEGLFG